MKWLNQNKIFEWLGIGRPKKKQPQGEWLTMKKSGIEHYFMTTGTVYRFSACGFSTPSGKLTTEPGTKKCPKCLKTKGW